MCKFLRSLAEYLAALAFLCCHYIFDSYFTSLILSFNTVYVFNSNCWTVIIWATFKSMSSKSRCSLDPKNFLRVLHPLKPPLGCQNTPRLPSSVGTCYAHFSTDYVHSLDHICHLYMRHPVKENQQHMSIFFFEKQTCVKNEWRNSFYY